MHVDVPPNDLIQARIEVNAGEGSRFFPSTADCPHAWWYDFAVAHTILAVDPATQHRGLLVEVYTESLPEPDLQQALAGLERRLFDRSIRVGIVATPEIVLVVRDEVTELTLTANRFRVRTAPTANLLEHAGLGKPRPGAAFMLQVRRWLEAIGSSWYSFLWPDAAPAMIPDVVGHLAQAELEEHDGLLDQVDAA
jgi:hypothetical protein